MNYDQSHSQPGSFVVLLVLLCTKQLAGSLHHTRCLTCMHTSSAGLLSLCWQVPYHACMHAAPTGLLGSAPCMGPALHPADCHRVRLGKLLCQHRCSFTCCSLPHAYTGDRPAAPATLLPIIFFPPFLHMQLGMLLCQYRCSCMCSLHLAAAARPAVTAVHGPVVHLKPCTASAACTAVCPVVLHLDRYCRRHTVCSWCGHH